jgi:hypothetical protein
MAKYKGLIIPPDLKSKKELAEILSHAARRYCDEDLFTEDGYYNCTGLDCTNCLMSYENYKLRLEWATTTTEWKPTSGDIVWEIDPVYLRVWCMKYSPGVYNIPRLFDLGWIKRTRQEARDIVREIKKILK